MIIAVALVMIDRPRPFAIGLHRHVAIDLPQLATIGTETAHPTIVTATTDVAHPTTSVNMTGGTRPMIGVATIASTRPTIIGIDLEVVLPLTHGTTGIQGERLRIATARLRMQRHDLLRQEASGSRHRLRTLIELVRRKPGAPGSISHGQAPLRRRGRAKGRRRSPLGDTSLQRTKCVVASRK